MTIVYGNDAASVDAIDADFLVRDDIDPTKILNLQVSGLATGTTRILTVPNANGTIALTSDISASGIVSIDGVANAGGDVDLVAGSTKISITPNDGLNNITLDVVEANLSLSNIGGAVTDAQVPNTITLDNLTQVTTRSHTALSDIGTNTHAQVDTHIAGAISGSGTVNTVPKFTAIRTVADSRITDDGTTVGIGGAPSSPFFPVNVLINADAFRGICIENQNTGSLAQSGFFAKNNLGQGLQFGITGSNYVGAGTIEGNTAILLADSSSGLALNSFNNAGRIKFGIGSASTEIWRMASVGNFSNTSADGTAYIHLKAGTASASTAPLKLTSGTNNTTPEAGAIEFDGTNYFATTGTTRYTLAKTLTATAVLDFPSTPDRTSSDLTITVTGAADGDAVVLGVPNASQPANSSYSAFVSAANTVTVRFNNHSSAPIDPASGTFRVSVLKY